MCAGLFIHSLINRMNRLGGFISEQKAAVYGDVFENVDVLDAGVDVVQEELEVLEAVAK